jgi:hypothetical protein
LHCCPLLILCKLGSLKPCDLQLYILDGAIPCIPHKHTLSYRLLLSKPHWHFDLAVFTRLPAQYAAILAFDNILVLQLYFRPAGNISSIASAQI